MRYLEKKIKLARADLLSKIMIIFLSLTFLAAFTEGGCGQWLNEWRFQFFLLGLWGILYTLNYRFFGYCFLFFVLWLLNFFVISSSASLIFSDTENQATQAITLRLQTIPKTWLEVFEAAENSDILAVINPKIKEERKIKIPEKLFLSEGNDESSFVITDYQQQTAGKINFGQKNSGVFAKVKIKDKEYMTIMFDWSDLSRQQRSKAFEILDKFVSAQDNPIIIMGNFGTVAWNKKFAEFLSMNGLEVKNPIMSSAQNLLLPMTKYIVGYPNLEFDGDSFIPTENGRNKIWQSRLKI